MSDWLITQTIININKTIIGFFEIIITQIIYEGMGGKKNGTDTN